MNTVTKALYLLSYDAFTWLLLALQRWPVLAAV